MTDYTLTRREFVKGCCGAAVVGAAGSTLIFAGDAVAAANSYDTVVHLFLRGGFDGLNLVVPVSGNDRTHYEEARPSLSIDASGTYGALPLTLSSGAATGFGLHPSATGLRDLWNDGKLAIVHACGMATTVTRSHFDAQLYIDLGTPGKYGSPTGWMTRAWQTLPGSPAATMPVLGVAGTQPANLIGASDALVMSSPTDFQLNAGAWAWQQVRDDSPTGFKGHNETLAEMWAGRTGIEISGARAEAALDTIKRQSFASLPGNWPTGTFAQQLWTIAQSIRFNLGLRFATLDLGGWDTHEGQGTAGSGYHYYQNKIAELSQGLSAFFAELAAGGQMSRVTLVVQSEFGRRVRANANGGTDHGYGNPLLVLGGPVNGRRFYGSWPGLDPVVLSPTFGDIPVTTDYRRVFSEIMIRRMANPNLSTLFPGYAGYAPLGIVQGTDLAPTASAAAVRSSATPSPAATGTGESSSSRLTDTQLSRPLPASRLRGPVDRTLYRRER
ncbi:hypothetical protein CSC70_08050 [Pseudoxanthomonas kalamensis DSM 18571]|uniref:DUF1501 domain-containing protein n=1 Tax=Pseudoxanthomonas kalamensis TaxID=289483 RepID=UPI001391E0C2|nr:DUF1501 domain-containing protein [Pseudoxanthomonas kalamensis]KAF1710602.1 hypothetical protein CSC70_08050 [Pseudoxanthomonas kalamensis DSM 18571]